MKSSQQKRILGHFPRIHLSGPAGLKQRLVNIDVASVLIKPALKQRCFNQ